MDRVQYKAKRLCTGGVKGACKEKVRKIVVVESMWTLLDGVQANFIRRVMEDPCPTSGVWRAGVESTPRVKGDWQEFDTTVNYVAAKDVQ